MFGGAWGIQHWLVVLLVVLLLFGTGKVSTLMGDFAKGIKSFKKNMADDTDASAEAHVDRPAGSIAASTPPRPTTVGSPTETVHHS